MNDRETIIRVLKDIANDKRMLNHADYWALICAEAAELLKAQEPIEPKWRKGYAYCGQCGYKLHWIVDLNNFCPNCGRAVKWIAKPSVEQMETNE